ncbi:hypothetical protein HPB51_008465 [Rhipicephalus microplus]|uniref:Uncharacterized protein n=1 Tax=Rhipicephalus microplus TaxID=6941 RepID=A0A9J6ERM9_RHIMP|nr:hypothetical protein HPB51_008465 [Rhipicephalus microplus]
MIDERLKPRPEEEEAVFLGRERACHRALPRRSLASFVGRISRCLARATCPCFRLNSYTYEVRTWLPAPTKIPKHRPGYHTTQDMSTLAAARYQRSWTKKKPKLLSPFASRVQVIILQGASKPSRTLGSLQVLAWLPPPSGQVNHRGTTGQRRGGSQSRRRPPDPGVVQHAFDLLKYPIYIPGSEPPLRHYLSMDRTLVTRRRKFQLKSLSTSYGSRETLAVVVLYVIKLSRTLRASHDAATKI